MFVKNAISWFGQKLCATKDPTFTKQLLMPLLLLVSLKDYITRCTTEQKLFVVPPEIKNRADKARIILVLDLDQTLIYARDPSPPADKTHFFTVRGSDGTTIFVRPRPYVNEFLTAAASIFTLYVYTAGKKAYADAILDVIDTQRLIKKRFYRDSCVAKNRSFVKNLNKLPKDGPMFLVDDNPESIRLNTPNSLLVKSFQGDLQDRELQTIFSKLLDLYQKAGQE